VYSFFAYDPAFRGGAFVAAGDVNGDGFADIITGAGFGGAPHVKVFSGKDLSQLASFYAYDLSFRDGVHVGAGDVNGDGKADVITGAGPGGGPHVKVFDLAHGGGEVYSFFAYAESFFGGVYVGAGDVNGDGKADIITAAASGGSGHIRVFSGADGSLLNSFFAFSPNSRDGVTVAGVDPNRTGRTSIAAGVGFGAPGLVKLFDPATLSETDVFSTLDAGFQDGLYVG
jgi:fibronectin-binding autotransporter adhesin